MGAVGGYAGLHSYLRLVGTLIVFAAPIDNFTNFRTFAALAVGLVNSWQPVFCSCVLGRHSLCEKSKIVQSLVVAPFELKL